MSHVTRQHFRLAAEQVRAILAGEWTTDLPPWEPAHPADTSDAVRAIQTAEAYLLFFEAANSRFNRARFLAECGLIDGDKQR